jgi:CRP/FNR family transcriptional regulator, cyclic AMP receptor protein
MSLSEQLIHAAASHIAETASSPQQLVAGVAVLIGIGFIVAGALVRTMTSLRWLAVGSNLGLLAYGALHPSYATMVTAAVLLPINMLRAVEISRLAHRVRTAENAADHVRGWLRPYMQARMLKAGQTLFAKGDKAKHLFMLVEGQLELVEIGKPIEPGRIFGEIALFSPSGLRTNTVRCVTDCTVLEVDDRTVKQLYYQKPAFGFQLISLLAERLSGDVTRIESRFGELK